MQRGKLEDFVPELLNYHNRFLDAITEIMHII